MKKRNIFVSLVFILFIGGITVVNFLSRDLQFSEAENRLLAQKPKFTVERLISGKYTSEFETYLSDQFINKPFWTDLKAKSVKAIGKKENNGVLFGKDNFLFERFKVNNEQLTKNIDTLTYFANKAVDSKTYLMLVPTSIEIYKEKLPKYVESDNQKEVIDNIYRQLSTTITSVNLSEEFMKHKSEQLYFHTDHHWTMRGAYIAYRQLAKQMNFEPYDLDDFNIKIVTEEFRGTYDAKAHDKSVEADLIELFELKKPVEYDVKIVEKDASFTSLYDWDYLNKRDKYSFFLHGNNRLVTIKTNLTNGKKLLVIKDSYAHAFVPFLANHFEEIHLVDLRYYNENIYNYIDENGIQETLFLYNIANFTDDRNMGWLKQ